MSGVKSKRKLCVRCLKVPLDRDGFCPGCAEIIIAAVKEARSKKRRGP